MFGEWLQKREKQEIAECTNQELYVSLLKFVQELAKEKEVEEKTKKLYYISAEFLIGKLLGTNLINLGIYNTVKKELEQAGKSLNEIEEVEPEPSLGNGGLGRLAACFLDSIATLGLPGDGIGLNYHLGLFRQEFQDCIQKEMPNPWLEKIGWNIPVKKKYKVQFGDFSVTGECFDIAITGYGSRTNHLHLFDLKGVDETIVQSGIEFPKEEIKKNLTLFLYPDDSDEKGRLLRVYQQYFMVSCGAQMILEEARGKGSDLRDLYEYAVIQINDTHPTMVIPELIRLLIKEGIGWEEAVEITSKTCAYTNHTILAEALEKWPISYIEKVAPDLVPILKKLDEMVIKRYGNEFVRIIDQNKIVHMAHIDLHFCFSVNGVAHLHTEILKHSELNEFYQLYPEKFNNKTNGITFRRWLLACNPELSEWIESHIGNGFKKDANQLEQLECYRKDKNALEQLLIIKQKKKQELADYLREKQAIQIPADSIYDIQIKRLHEYKRQQLNVLYAIYKYQRIKEGNLPKRPITLIFGAKAAPAYTIAKDIIHLILCMEKLTSEDPKVAPYLRVVMVENYNVTLAEKLIPACDISEQISLASKEASGTGNMKFMLNGAVTLGTMDGANVEISQLVGEDNMYLFGERSETVIERYEAGNYNPRDYYEKNRDTKAAVDFITGPELKRIGTSENLERLQKELLNKDWFMTFPDFADYVKTKEKAYRDYEKRKRWAEKMLINISKAGFFSSDRTIEEYNRDIWTLR